MHHEVHLMREAHPGPRGEKMYNTRCPAPKTVNRPLTAAHGRYQINFVLAANPGGAAFLESDVFPIQVDVDELARLAIGAIDALLEILAIFSG